MQPITNKCKRIRRFLLIAPLGVVALLTFLFNAFGGGEGLPAPTLTGKGINVTVPEAHLKADGALNKSAFYKKAALDSLNQREKQKGGETVSKTGDPGGDSLPVILSNTDPNEEKVKRQVAIVHETLSQVIAAQSDRKGPYPAVQEKKETFLSSQDVDRLERMQKMFKNEGMGVSPEIQELNKVMDKLITVQHPGVPTDTGARNMDPVSLRPLAVLPAQPAETISSWKTETGNRFYDLQTNNGEEKPEATGIEAIIPETQTLIDKARLRLELLTDLVVRNTSIPRGTALFGVVHLNDERLQVAITSIHYHDRSYPVSLQVIDGDGLTGIYEPGSISRDVARESVGESINGIGGIGLSQSLEAQVANTGVQMVRSLAGKKIRLVRVTVPKGHLVFLKDMSASP